AGPRSRTVTARRLMPAPGCRRPVIVSGEPATRSVTGVGQRDDSAWPGRQSLMGTLPNIGAAATSRIRVRGPTSVVRCRVERAVEGRSSVPFGVDQADGA